ncbi:MAG: Ca2+-dependent phosphoinositide-specific phospholipase C [Chitinophagales bacterium]
MKRYLLLPLLALLFVTACKKEEKKKYLSFDNGPTDSLTINQIQVLASHNSYHLRMDDTIYVLLHRLDSLGLLPSQYDPVKLDYTNIPFDEQFDNYNVRGLEIDIFNDPVGGQYYYRKGLSLVGLDNDSHIPELLEPGFKVLHIPDFDYKTLHITFKQSLQAIYNWSMAHPNHLPLFINVETNEETVAQSIPGLDLTQSIPYDASACDKMDEEIKAVFGENLDKVITPDEVRGTYTTLEQAALAKNWPKLASARNKVVFIMQGEAESLYKAGHSSLQGRAMFVYSSPGSPEAAFVIMNSPVGNETLIQQRVAAGYIVRTRCDGPGVEVFTNDYTQMNSAFASGAQILTTDYYKADYRAGTGAYTNYQVQLPNGDLARINAYSAADKQGLGKIGE